MNSPPDTEIIVDVTDLSAALAFLGAHGFRIERLTPADDPAIVVMSGHGVSLRLRRAAQASGLQLLLPQLQLSGDAGDSVIEGPDGIGLRSDSAVDDGHTGGPSAPDAAPADGVIVSRSTDLLGGMGRAGMHYLDLVPDRVGGRFIASKISIPEGGDVDDWVHHHDVRFQVIICLHGWVEVVYEDQGPPFILESGDCVLQPPHIRHRVLRSSDALEVLEVSGPATHDTWADHDLVLPTNRLRRTRDFDGQKFVRHVGRSGAFVPSALPGFEERRSGIAEASAQAGDVRFLRRCGDVGGELSTSREFWLASVQRGWLRLTDDTGEVEVGQGDSLFVRRDTSAVIVDAAVDLQMVVVDAD